MELSQKSVNNITFQLSFNDAVVKILKILIKKCAYRIFDILLFDIATLIERFLLGEAYAKSLCTIYLFIKQTWKKSITKTFTICTENS